MEKDNWQTLRKHTHARIAIGHAGNSLPTSEILALRMAHSMAKDALNSEIDLDMLSSAFASRGLNTVSVKSQVTGLNDYLRNPNKGRLPDKQSAAMLQTISPGKVDLCIIVADGLSANAVNYQAPKLIDLLLPHIKTWTLAPIVLAKYGRVALSDAVGEILNADIALILIGERPGLSSPHSMGAYMTFHPVSGNTDEKRNCVSNIQPEGLSYEAAAAKIAHLLNQMRIKQISGVQLKDDQSDIYLV
jgi:ethanolamine ammonia-lyase small subunit